MISGIFSVDSVFWTTIWQSTMFLSAGLVMSFVMRHRSARAHRILLLSIIASVFVPVMTVFVRHLGLGIFETVPVKTQTAIEEPQSELSTEPFIIAPTQILLQPQLPAENTTLLEPAEESIEVPSAFGTFIRQHWRLILLFSWIAISFLLTFRLLVTFLLGIRLLSKAETLDNERINKALQHAKEKLGICKDVRLYGSKSIKSPVIWCWRVKPVLLVPKDAERFHERIDWTGVLCHELAHWKRRDHISGLIAELAACILPWQILLWLTKSRLINLSEHACDDWVIATGKAGTDYAESLLDMTPGGQMAFVPAVVRNKNGIAQRVQRILKDSCGNPRTGFLWAVAACIIACSIAVTVAFAQTRPPKSNTEKAEVNILKMDSLPDGWELSYDDGIGGRYWPANISNDLIQLNIIPAPANEYDESWKDEKLELSLLSKQKEPINTIIISTNQEDNKIVIAPEQYNLIYKRAKRDTESSSFTPIESIEFPIDLSKSGMYKLKFRPKIESSETIESGIYPAAVCTGTVIDENGNPIKDTQVAAYETFFDKAGNISMRFVSKITTTSEGIFTLEVAPTVTKNRSQGGIIVAEKDGFAIGWAHWPLYGEQNVKITLQNPVNISGQVLDDNNNPISNAEVRAVLFEDKKSEDSQTKWLPGVKPLDRLTVHTDNNGRFEFDNIPRNVSSGFLVSASGFGTMYSCEPDGQGGYKNIKYAAGSTDIEVTLSAEAIIEGKATDEKTGEALADEVLSIIPHFTGTFFERYLCTTKEDGTFRITGLRSGKYVIRRAGQSANKIDIVAESGKTNSDIIIKLPRDIPITETVHNRIEHDENQVKATTKPVNSESNNLFSKDILYCYNIPDSWSLNYEKNITPEGTKQGFANMANNLSSLEILPKPKDVKDESWKNEDFNFRIYSIDGTVMGNIIIRHQNPELSDAHKIFQPGRYILKYERQYGEPGKNYRVNSDTLLLDMSQPGMYQLHFNPKLGNCEISGSAGGCYAVNFELVGAKDFPVWGLAYINREQEYRLDGLPNGTYRLSAVDQQSNGNVVVSQTQVTIENESKVTFDIAPPPKGDCSLTGSIFGKQNTYTVGSSTNPIQSKGEWFVLLRNHGSGKVTTTDVYEAKTMDSKYVIRGSENIVQETPEKANFKIDGIAPGEYNVTVIESPNYQGVAITRQQSKLLIISAGKNAVLDFDFSDNKDQQVSSEPLVAIQFSSLGINQIIKSLTEWTGKKVIASEKAKDLTFAIYATEKITKSNAINLIYNAINYQGFLVEETEDTIYIKHREDLLNGGRSSLSDFDRIQIIFADMETANL